jgi:hypothetical protein
MACECAICALKIDFDLDKHLLEEIEGGRCIIFAGSGISTETTGAHSFSFYTQIANLVESDGTEKFWEIIDKFEDQPNGRQKLIEQIRGRFDYIDSWRDLRDAATRFHRSVATAPYFASFITTNWDRYFEDVIRATPFVYDSDLVFWESASRPVLKIHGSIDNLSTLVASSEDYDLCEKRLRNGRLGDLLRHLFATRTIIFVGYSATDSDFLSIYNSVRGSLGRLARVHYLVSPFLNEAQRLELRSDLNVIGIKTDASYFVETVKSHMREKFCFAFDDAYDEVEVELDRVAECHIRFIESYSVGSEPHLIFSTAYQDGLIHGFKRIVDRRYTNDFADLHRVRGQIALYGDKISEYTKQKDYWNASYFEGYQMALIFFDVANAKLDPKHEVSEDLDNLPLFYHPGQGVMDQDEFEQRVRPDPAIHKAALRQAKRIAKQYEGADDMVVQHTPFG